MCGICGYLSKKNISEKVLKEMRDTISYRGPDDTGIWNGEYQAYHIGFAHCRLSIVDLSDLGHQPMISKNGRFIIVYNGEVYNQYELRKELESKGCQFRSSCDTEVVLNSFEQWGTKCFEKINGMFAVAIWDSKMGRLTLARDRIGKKPLYFYYNKAIGDFVFASELKPIMKFPDFSKHIKKEAISDFFCNKYIAAPNTIFENVYKMIPGSILEFSNNGMHQERFWNILRAKKNGMTHLITNPHEMVTELEDVICDSVKRRMIADVSVGAFLSGGIDSTLVSTLAQQEISNPIKTFSIGFYNKEKDEAPFSKEIANYIGADHTELYIDDEQLFKMIGKISVCYDEPMSDASQIPTMIVSRLASNEVKVVLTGDGGDESFCGYKMYDWIYWVQKLNFVGKTLAVIPKLKECKKIPIELRAFMNNCENDLKTQLFTDVRMEVVKDILTDGIVGDIKYRQEKYMHYTNWQERRMMLDMITYLPDDILCKMDRASMYYSIEARCPLLDYRVIEKSFQIPQEEKYKRFSKKYILKELTYRHVPKELLDRPKKGFSPPIQSWICGPLNKCIKKYADGKILDRQGIFDKVGVNKLIKLQEKSAKISYTSVVWSFFVFQNWYQTYCEDLWE